MRKCPKKLRELGFLHGSGCDTEHCRLQESLRITDLATIELKKDERTGQCRSLVAINEGVVLAQMVGVRRAHIVEFAMEPFTRERGFGLRHRRFKEPQVPDTMPAPIAADLIGVNVNHLCQGQEQRVGGQ